VLGDTFLPASYLVCHNLWFHSHLAPAIITYRHTPFMVPETCLHAPNYHILRSISKSPLYMFFVLLAVFELFVCHGRILCRFSLAAVLKLMEKKPVLQVQNLIERCLQLYMNQKEVVDTLSFQAKIEPSFTEIGNPLQLFYYHK
jgi:hypothetical protein